MKKDFKAGIDDYLENCQLNHEQPEQANQDAASNFELCINLFLFNTTHAITYWQIDLVHHVFLMQPKLGLVHVFLYQSGSTIANRHYIDD